MTAESPLLTPTSLASDVSRAQRVAILDCGAQYTKVIDRRVRELSVCSDILPLNTPIATLAEYGAIILSGGPNSVFEPDAPAVDPALFETGRPILGICYGMQLIAHHLHGVVEPGQIREYGETKIEINPNTFLFSGLAPQEMVLMSHGDKVTQLPEGFERLGQSGSILAAMGHLEKRIYGVQFHPEVELTEHGTTMLFNFLFNIAGLEPSFRLDNRLESLITDLRQQIGNHPVFVLVSGGVDSAVTAALLLKAVGPEQVYALHMDTGMMRWQESDSVCQALAEQGLKNLKRIDAADIFLNATTDLNGQHVGPLNQETNPEAKRRIIGDTFFHLTQEAITSMGLDLDKTFIAQGTLRPDLIESGSVEVSQIAHKIKTHHNDVPLIQAQREKGLIIEPNKDLHKDEVRQMGRLLGLPEAIVSRQPFPGPGLAIRVLCATQPYLGEDFDSLQADLSAFVATQNYQAHVLPVQSVGVQGDFRTYSHLAVLSSETVTEHWDELRTLVQAIPNQFRAINRVGLLLGVQGSVSPTPIRSILPTTLTPETLDLLRRVDRDVQAAFLQAGCASKLSQSFCVLVPVDMTGQNQRPTIAIRAVVTSDFMTARPAQLGKELPREIIQGLAQQLLKDYPLSGVLYDCTGKPPATVEWE